jgi:hypothetical protein
MTRTATFALALMLGLTAFTPAADAKKGGAKGWKGPPPHAKAYGHYKKSWPGYGWYDEFYAPPIYVWPAPPAYAPPLDVWRPAPLPAPEELPPSPPMGPR